MRYLLRFGPFCAIVSKHTFRSLYLIHSRTYSTSGRHLAATVSTLPVHAATIGRKYSQSMASSDPASTLVSANVQSGFADAGNYDRHRPTYPDEAVERLLTHLNVVNASANSTTVMDLAAGTGKFTEILASRPELYDIIAVEPHDQMRAQLEAKKLRGVRTVRGTAERMDQIPSESVDAVIASQSFHFFANADALEEIYRVLKPTAVFGMIWNIEHYKAPLDWDLRDGWEKRMRDLIWSVPDDGAPRFRHSEWKKVFDQQIKGTPFTIQASADPMFGLPIGEEKVPFESWLSKEDVWKRFTTYSEVVNSGEQKLKEIKQKVADALNSKDAETDSEGRVLIRGSTYMAWTSKIPGRPLKEAGGKP